MIQAATKVSDPDGVSFSFKQTNNDTNKETNKQTDFIFHILPPCWPSQTLTSDVRGRTGRVYFSFKQTDNATNKQTDHLQLGNELFVH